jgi:hypothetical protein
MQRLHTNLKTATSGWTTELSAKMSNEEILKKRKEAVEDVAKMNHKIFLDPVRLFD